jgi:cation transport ATPase
MTHTYTITGMTCGGCVARVKSELLKLGDVADANVQLAAPQATITMGKHIPTEKLQEAVSKAGHYKIADDNTSMHHASSMDNTADNQSGSYYPIFLIFGFITGITLLVQFVSGSFMLEHWMSQFMAGFFIVFSFFKLLDLKGFAEGYRTYDVVAKVFPGWGFIYPFVELILGLLFLTGLYSFVTNVVTFVVMGVSSIGVIQSLLKKTKFQCACLGTIFKVPLSKVTLTEDLLMVVMSGIMITMMLV